MPDERPPVVVCGMPRSGTTLIGKILGAGPDLCIFPELAPGSVDALLTVMERLRLQYLTTTWLGVRRAEVEQRLLTFLRHACEASRWESEPPCPADVRFGVKHPGMEAHIERLDAVLASSAPTYVYVIRDPEATYGSVLRMPWGDLDPAVFRDRFRESVESVLGLQAADPERLLVIDIDALRGGSERREAMTAAFATIGVPMSLASRELVDGWPPVNRVPDNIGVLDSAEISRRVRAFGKGRKHAELTGLVAEVRDLAGRAVSP